MMASVYRTWEYDVKLPRPRERVHGNLLLVKDGRGDQRWLTARLVGDDGEKLLPLVKAEVRRITDHGMVISGTEMIARTRGAKSNVRACRQVWWVFLWSAEGVDRYQGDDPLEAMAGTGGNCGFG